MRKWHRWISVFFGVFMLWIAVTGLLSQVVPWFQPPREPRPAATAPATPAAGGQQRANGDAAPQPRERRPSIIGTLHHLHSGESFGPVGQFISALSGIALIFFAVSGLWMYIRMFANRVKRGTKPRWFWK